MPNRRSTPKIKNAAKTDVVRANKIDGGTYPVFCFKHLQDASIRGSKDADFFINFLKRLQKLAELGWKEIGKSPRHSFGTEQMQVNQIRPTTRPSIMTPDVTHLTVFRANGDNRSFLGIQENDVFHVIFIETHFGDIYNHTP